MRTPRISSTTRLSKNCPRRDSFPKEFGRQNSIQELTDDGAGNRWQIPFYPPFVQNQSTILHGPVPQVTSSRSSSLRGKVSHRQRRFRHRHSRRSVGGVSQEYFSEKRSGRRIHRHAKRNDGYAKASSRGNAMTLFRRPPTPQYEPPTG